MKDKLKKIIFKKLYRDLSHVEIICHTDGSIWFIDREEKYWYLEFEKSGKLWWRYQFFYEFFQFFSIEQSEFKPLIVEWVEEVLNRKVVSTRLDFNRFSIWVEEVLNRKVVSTPEFSLYEADLVEEVLNRKVVSTRLGSGQGSDTVEEVLNRKVVSTGNTQPFMSTPVEEVLNRKVVSTMALRGY